MFDVIINIIFLSSMRIFRATNSCWQNATTLEPASNHIENILHESWTKHTPGFVTEYVKSEELIRLSKWARSLHENGIQYLIVMGIGSASLVGKLIRNFSSVSYIDNVVFWEGTHPKMLKRYANFLEKTKVALLWISKSGLTLEPKANISLVREYFNKVPEYFITSYPENIKDLCTIKEKIFLIPESLNGRFSIFSAVGIMPGLFLKAPMGTFLQHFEEANESYHISIPLKDNPAKRMAVSLYQLIRQNYQGIAFWVYSKELIAWGHWIVRLWAESLGKSPDFVFLPYFAKGPEDQHSLLQFFLETKNRYAHVFVHTKSYAPINTSIPGKSNAPFSGHTLWEILNFQMKGFQMALTKKQHAVCEYIFSNLYTQEDGNLQSDFALLARWITYWMYVVTYTGYLLNINPFDNPHVDLVKDICHKLLNNKVDSNEFLSDKVEEL